MRAFSFPLFWLIGNAHDEKYILNNLNNQSLKAQANADKTQNSQKYLETRFLILVLETGFPNTTEKQKPPIA